jgi:hypothetical protein
VPVTRYRYCHGRRTIMPAPLRLRLLTPEEESIGEPDDDDESDIDDDLPADLWFRDAKRKRPMIRRTSSGLTP